MAENINRLEVDADLKKLALDFIQDIEDSTTNFIFPVIGDFIIDRYKLCNVERRNLEHDSLIYDLADTSCFYGGASNVANIVGTFSKDSHNKSVEFFLGCGTNDPLFLKKIGLQAPETFKLNIYCDDKYDRVIPVKTRYIGVNRSVYLCRVDDEPTREDFPSISDDVAWHITQDIGKLNTPVIFISDYSKGFISTEILESLFCLHGYNHKYTYCNIRPKRIEHYIDRMYFLSFNKTEFIQTYEMLFDENLDVISIDNVKQLKDKLRLYNIIITFGGNGFIYCGESDCCLKVDPIRNLSTGSRNIIGAGDMVAASYSFFDAINGHILREKYDRSVILYLVSIAAFLKVYSGAYCVSLDQIRSFLGGKLLLF